jgi:hypothetical protein
VPCCAVAAIVVTKGVRWNNLRIIAEYYGFQSKFFKKRERPDRCYIPSNSAAPAVPPDKVLHLSLSAGAARGDRHVYHTGAFLFLSPYKEIFAGQKSALEKILIRS